MRGLWWDCSWFFFKFELCSHTVFPATCVLFMDESSLCCHCSLLLPSPSVAFLPSISISPIRSDQFPPSDQITDCETITYNPKKMLKIALVLLFPPLQACLPNTYTKASSALCKRPDPGCLWQHAKETLIIYWIWHSLSYIPDSFFDLSWQFILKNFAILKDYNWHMLSYQKDLKKNKKKAWNTIYVFSTF